MGVGNARNKGDRDQFLALEGIYLALSRSDSGRQKLQTFLGFLAANPSSTTCDALSQILRADRLGPDEIQAINKNWYGRGGQAQWHPQSELNPAQIQAVNRVATAYYVSQVMDASTSSPDAQFQIWGQCDHPRFYIVVRTNPANGPITAPYITVDYYVPSNMGDYGGGSPPSAQRYPERDPQGREWTADLRKVGMRHDPYLGTYFFYTEPQSGTPPLGETESAAAREACAALPSTSALLTGSSSSGSPT